MCKNAKPRNEFEIDVFAERYELLSDTFIDMPRVVDSIEQLLPKCATVFEIGLGTGYFASELIARGYRVEGIQPRDAMLPRLRMRGLPIIIRAEATLEEYVFDQSYQAIISHSSVFLFTKHTAAFGESGELRSELVFQSFIADGISAFSNLLKALGALSFGGKLYINVQRNPLRVVEVGPEDDMLRFEMSMCSYDFVRQRVTKHFRSTFRDKCILVEDVRYCLPYTEFTRHVNLFGVKVEVTSDGLWVVISP